MKVNRKRDKTLTIRVTEKEKEYIKKRAKKQASRLQIIWSDFLSKLRFMFLQICNHFCWNSSVLVTT